MPTYAIGDIQGCFKELQQLLAKINFDEEKDTLWFTGDLVNRGPQSLEVLRFIKSLGEKHISVLGNHDLHLISIAYGLSSLHNDDTLTAILNAHDRDELIDWLRHRPLLHHDKKTAYVMTHAGLAPFWTIEKAKKLAHEVEHTLQGNNPEFFLKHLYGNEPKIWDDKLSGFARLRVIVNYLTRMRFCLNDGSLDLSYKGEIAGSPKGLIPWYQLQNRVNAHIKIIFGHWAALNGKVNAPNIYALDTGCVWGNCLTAMRIDDELKFTVSCTGLQR